MTLSRNAVVILAILILTGCQLERGGVIDFANPLFDLRCGPVALIAFPHETALHIGTTYLILRLPFYFPVIACILLAVGLRVMISRRKDVYARASSFGVGR